jgi:hypothetical protein
MTPNMHGDPFEPSIEQVARTLLEFARQEPSLVGRTHALARSAPSGAPAFDLSSFTGFTQIDLARQLEDLTSIAIAAAQQAEDAFRQSRETVRIARRNTIMFGLLGAVGILSGAASIADNYFSAPGVPAAIVQAAPTPPAVDGPSAELARLPATYVPTLPLPLTPIQPLQDHFVPPAYHPPPTFVAPWPSQTVAIRHEPVAERRTVALPSSVVALRRELSSLQTAPPDF